MNAIVNKVWTGFLRPLLQRPKGVQLAALCYKQSKNGTKVLLVTSRGTGRWIIPKGWPITGTTSYGTAVQEAWEEAGVHQGIVGDSPVGSYVYNKGLREGRIAAVETVVYPVEVTKLKKSFPEASQRKRQWFDPLEAAELVDEPQLAALLRRLALRDDNFMTNGHKRFKNS